MTVGVSVLTRDGVVVAFDSLVSRGPRQYASEDKVEWLGDKEPYFAGISGSLSDGHDFLRALSGYVTANPGMNFDHLKQAAAGVYASLVHKRIQDAVLSPRGVTWEHYHHGAIAPDVRSMADRAIEDGDLFSVNAIVGGYDAETRTPRHCIVSAPGVAKEFQSPVYVGSGVDRADTVLSEYMEMLMRQRIWDFERGQMEFPNALELAMDAVREGRRNSGVGGRTRVLAVRNNGARWILENTASTVLTNLLTLAAGNDAARQHVKKAFAAVEADKGPVYQQVLECINEGLREGEDRGEGISPLDLLSRYDIS